jgi:tetratricopeptide (TPR) repeat protein
MMSSQTEWVKELFFLLDIPVGVQEWQEKLKQTMHSLRHEVQFVVSTMNNNEQQLVLEAQKRVTSAYINGHRSSLTPEIKVSASEILLRNQQPELALTIMQPIDMDASPAYLINFGRALMQLCMLDQAKHCFISAAEKEPQSAEPLFHLGFHASINGDIQAAERFYTESLQRDAQHAGSLLNLAYLYYQLERFEDAIEHAERALAHDETTIGAYLTIASCLNAQSRFTETLEMIGSARAHISNYVAELDELEAVACLELEQYVRAVELVDSYLAAKPAAVDLKYVRARARLALGSWQQALDDIDALLSLEPYDTETLEMRFKGLLGAERWSEAELAYIKLLEGAPQLRFKYHDEYTVMRKNLAIVLGDTKEAN